MSTAPRTAAVTAQIVAQQTRRPVMPFRYPAAYATELMLKNPGRFGMFVFGPMSAVSAGHADQAVVEFAATVGEPLLDVMVEMADAHLRIEGLSWTDEAEREQAIESCRADLERRGLV